MWKKKIEEIKKFIMLDAEVDSFDTVKKDFFGMNSSHNYIITDIKAYKEKLAEIYTPLKTKNLASLVEA